jgi:hypothetical protein
MLSNHLAIAEADIRFESLGELTNIPDRGLSLFLYRIVENSHLKNFDSGHNTYYSNPIIIQKPPIALDLYYLIAPFGNSEQRLITLENIMQFFHSNPVINKDHLSNAVLESGNKEIKILMNDITVEQLNSLWNMFPNTQYRPIVSYLLTPLLINPVIPSDSTAPRVTSETFTYLDKDE